MKISAAVLSMVILFAAGSHLSAAETLAVVDTTLIPMDVERTVSHQTVIVRDGIIAAIGPTASTPVPPDARRVDGRGKFLLPGLADMHTHVDVLGQLPLFVQAGVTTVLNMGLASPRFVALERHRVDEGRAVGPHVLAAFMIDGPGDPGPQFVPACPSEARAAVDRAQLLGYEFIKAYGRLQPEMYDAVLDEARKIGMPVVGHIPTAVGLEKSLAAGQVMIAHAEEYWKTFLQQSGDSARIAQAVALTRSANAFVTPNLGGFAMITARTSTPEIVDRILARPHARFLPPAMRASWEGQKPAKPSDRFVAEFQTLQALTLALAQGGVPLLAGTDTPGIVGTIPGDSIHDELDNLVAVGLTPFQALSAATRTPGEFVQKFVPNAEQFGTLAVGNRGDFVLLAANPLRSVRNARSPLGVAVRGRWYTAAQLEAIITEPVHGYDAVIAAEKRFTSTIDRNGAATAIRALPRRPEIPESFFNTTGYRLINSHKLNDAIAVFALNTRLHPDSWNAWDSLGEAELDAGRFGEAVRDYRASLALNARNAGAERVLKKLADSKPAR